MSWFEVSGVTGTPSIIINLTNNTITINGNTIFYNKYTWVQIPTNTSYDFSNELQESSHSSILYYDQADRALHTVHMGSIYNLAPISWYGESSSQKIILGIIYILSGQLNRINFSGVLQRYLKDKDGNPINTNSSIGATMSIHDLWRSYFGGFITSPNSDIQKLIENGKVAYDCNHPENFKINLDSVNHTIQLRSSGTNYLWDNTGKFRNINSDYNSDFDLTGLTNTSILIAIDTASDQKKIKCFSATNSNGLKYCYSNQYMIIIATMWVSIDCTIQRVVPFSQQFDKCFYQDNVQYKVPRVYDLPEQEVVINNTEPQLYDISDIGHLNKQDIGSTDYSHIILYGQSLSMGWEAPEVITTTPVDNCYMVGSSPMINHGNDGSLTLNPLIAVKWSSGGEQPVVGLTNSFATLYNDNHSIPQKFIGTNCGEGGKSIEKMMKQCTNGTNFYTTEFLDCINSAKGAVDALNKTISCPAIFYMQGEYNYVQLTGNGLTPGSDATNDKEQYKTYLLQLKNDMQTDIMSTYGQTKKPLFFIYQVAGNYINRRDMSITMAQIEFAQEHDDVFLMNSTYGMPDYGGGHLSTNGYRWYGEMMAKSMYQVFENRKQWNGLELTNIQIDGKNVLCDFRVPVLPLVFDNWTKESRTQNGFRIFKDNTEVTISNMTIIGNRVILVTNTTLTGNIEITYAGQGPIGSGNLRDSDEFNSLYTYFDDRETAPAKRENYTPKDKDGNYIYGKKYPMYNWANHFYKQITIN